MNRETLEQRGSYRDVLACSRERLHGTIIFFDATLDISRVGSSVPSVPTMSPNLNVEDTTFLVQIFLRFF